MPDGAPHHTVPGHDGDGGSRKRRASALKRAAQGLILAVGAPCGWLAIRWMAGHSPGAELWAFPWLYTYLLVATAVVFAAFGFYTGGQEDKLLEKNRALVGRAITDRLTGLRNSEYFWGRIREAVARTRRDGTQLSLVMIDLDHFKSVNDRFGHWVGDQVLSAAGRVIAENVREADMAARVGGEEFAVVLPETSIEQARQIAKRLREAFASLDFSAPDGTRFGATLSAGVASAVGDAADEEKLYRAADRAVYEAKKDGRDCVRTVRVN